MLQKFKVRKLLEFGKRLNHSYHEASFISKYTTPILDIDSIINENVHREVSAFYRRFNLNFSQNDDLIFKDVSLYQENNSQLSLDGYFTTKSLLNFLISNHYSNKLPDYLNTYFLNFLLSRESLSEISDKIGLTDILRIYCRDQDLKNAVGYLRDGSFIKKSQAYDINRKLSFDDLKCASFFSLIQTLFKIHGINDTLYFLDNLVFSRISNIDLSEIGKNILDELIKEIAKREKIGNVRFICNKSSNEVFRF